MSFFSPALTKSQPPAQLSQQKLSAKQSLDSGPLLFSALRAASLALPALIFVLITLGGLVRNAGAGLACPDWPLCFGRVVPPMDYQVFLEWFHRLIAGSVSVFLLGLSAVVFWRRDLRAALGRYCAAGLALLFAQVALGGLTVLGLLNPKWVSSHLAVGLAFFGTMVWLALKLRDHLSSEPVPEPAPPRESAALLPGSVKRLALVAAGALYAQILLGGLVSSNYAGLACPDFPTCNGSWWPSLEGLVLFQWTHRLGAVAATLAVLGLVVGAWRHPLGPRARLAVRALPVFLAVQLALGIGSVFLKLPLLMSVAHLGTAAALFGMLVVMNYEVRHA